MKQIENKEDTKRRTPNERFGATAAVTPQKILCGIEILSPATKVVEAAAAPSRHPVSGKADSAVRIAK